MEQEVKQAKSQEVSPFPAVCHEANLRYQRINRILSRSPMQTEKSEPEGKRIMAETRCTEHYPLTRGLGFLDLHRRPMFDYFPYLRR